MKMMRSSRSRTGSPVVCAWLSVLAIARSRTRDPFPKIVWYWTRLSPRLAIQRWGSAVSRGKADMYSLITLFTVGVFTAALFASLVAECGATVSMNRKRTPSKEDELSGRARLCRGNGSCDRYAYVSPSGCRHQDERHILDRVGVELQ